MEESSRDSGGDGDQVALAGEDFYVAGAGEIREIDGASGTDSGGCGFVSGDTGHLRQEFAGVDGEFK